MITMQGICVCQVTGNYIGFGLFKNEGISIFAYYMHLHMAFVQDRMMAVAMLDRSDTHPRQAIALA